VYIRDNYVTKDTLVFSSQDDSLCINISGSVLTLDNDLFFLFKLCSTNK